MYKRWQQQQQHVRPPGSKIQKMQKELYKRNGDTGRRYQLQKTVETIGM